MLSCVFGLCMIRSCLNCLQIKTRQSGGKESVKCKNHSADSVTTHAKISAPHNNGCFHASGLDSGAVHSKSQLI